MKRLVVALIATAVALGPSARADNPPATPPASTDADLHKTKQTAAFEQERLRRQFNEFQQKLLALAQRYEKSSKPEERERALVLKQAIELAAKEGVDNQFNKLVVTLTGSGVTLAEINAAMGQNEQLIKTLNEMISVLMTDNQSAKLKEEQRRLQELLKQLERVIREQKLERSKTEAGRQEGKELAKSQGKVTEDTKKLSKAMDPKANEKGKTGEPNDGQGKSKDGDGKPKDGGGKPKDGDGKPKDGGGKPKDGDGKPKDGDGKPGQPMPGDGQPNDGQQGQQSQEEQLPQRQVKDAVENQQNAEDRLKKNDRQKASNEQDEAIKKLEEARKEIERRLKQLREEEQLQRLANLESRCNRMLAMQIAVYEATKRLHGTVLRNEGQKPSRADDLKAGELSGEESKIVSEANKALQLLEEDGTAVAVPQVLEQCRDDMKVVQARLFKTDVGQFTQQVEEEIIAALKEVIEALKRAQQEIKDKQNQPPPPGGGPPPDQRLITILAELKMIRSLQVRVNQRTTSYAKQYPGEQADDPDIQKELRGLGQRQIKIEKATKDIATGKVGGQ
jgi:hypothetical protein